MAVCVWGVILLKEINSTAAGTFPSVSLWPVCSSDSIDFFLSVVLASGSEEHVMNGWRCRKDLELERERDFSFLLCFNASSLHTHAHTHAALFRAGLRDRCRNDWKLWHSQIQNSLPFGKCFGSCFKCDAVTVCAANQISHDRLCM